MRRAHPRNQGSPALPVHEGRRRGWAGLRVSRHVLTTVAVGVLSLSVLGPPVQAQDNPSAQELADLSAIAEAGATEAQYSIGVKYDTGEGVPQDDAEAVIWYRRAARAGSRRCPVLPRAYVRHRSGRAGGRRRSGPVVPPGRRAGSRRCPVFPRVDVRLRSGRAAR